MSHQTQAMNKASKKSKENSDSVIIVYQDDYSNYKVCFYDDFLDEYGVIVAKFLNGALIG